MRKRMELRHSCLGIGHMKRPLHCVTTLPRAKQCFATTTCTRRRKRRILAPNHSWETDRHSTRFFFLGLFRLAARQKNVQYKAPNITSLLFNSCPRSDMPSGTPFKAQGLKRKTQCNKYTESTSAEMKKVIPRALPLLGHYLN